MVKENNHNDGNVKLFQTFCITRSYAALRAADLDWIVGPGYSSGRYILGKNHEKPTWNREKPTWNHGSQLAFEMGEGAGQE